MSHKRRLIQSGDFERLIENAAHGVVAVDADGLIVLLNAHAERMFGYGRAELYGRPIEILVPERSRERHVLLRGRFAAGPSVRPMGAGLVLRACRKDGSEFYAEIGLSAVAIDASPVVVATVVDISERLRLEATIQSTERARMAIEICQQAGIAAAVVDGSGVLSAKNRRFESMGPHPVRQERPPAFFDSAAGAAISRAVASIASGATDRGPLQVAIPATEDRPALVVHLFGLHDPHGAKQERSSVVLAFTAVSIDEPGGVDAESLDVLHRLFSLTPAEARLVALVGSGTSPRHAARVLGISEETARTTLKHIFVKTGISRQSQLAVLFTKLVR